MDPFPQGPPLLAHSAILRTWGYCKPSGRVWRAPAPNSCRSPQGPGDRVLSRVHPALSWTFGDSPWEHPGDSSIPASTKASASGEQTAPSPPPGPPNPTSLPADRPVNTASPGENMAFRGRACPSKQPVSTHTHSHTHTHIRARTHSAGNICFDKQIIQVSLWDMN